MSICQAKYTIYTSVAQRPARGPHLARDESWCGRAVQQENWLFQSRLRLNSESQK